MFTVCIWTHAHCKHVQCVLFALVSFIKTKTMLTSETCTQRLQTFHKCKRYRGSPIKAAQLTLRKSEKTGDKEIRKMSDYDPRPAHLVNTEAYASTFNNLSINYQAACGSVSTATRNPLPMPILQIIPPANMYAIANDHDYLKNHPENNFLEALGLMNLSMEEIARIEERTRQQSQDKAWFCERTKRLQSSRFGRICKATERTDKKSWPSLS